MSLYDAPETAANPRRFLRTRWMDIRAAIFRWFDRERELIRMRITIGMMAEARRGDAREYHEMLERARKLSERVGQLELEREAWRSGKV